ncbi:NADH-quinone oxidoreductase subunit L [Methyloligella sp. 2.7D]|uniref:NADH-quinone oxidoreductase subunit L n=1 Tax=unclassified Methyloligella TaxID=2625955 RepID=UPI00157D1D71|nr:NADH-quinone oxidoreductase subunit L [Methyloligella sp. GL2]QKP77539.1 NADH-quinone oxidoreductase subunit L [Methyloligella sp. GL2]
MYEAILFLPLAGAIFAGFFGRLVGYRACEVVTTTFMMVACALSWIAFYYVTVQGQDVRIELFTWIQSGELTSSWDIRVDTLTAVMLVVVNTVSALVHLYSVGYMDHDPHKQRFFAYLSLFTFAMLTLVTSDNLLQLFFGWEGVGLASYLLIGFWYEKPSACAAAIKAFVVNRVGDFGFALGIFATFTLFGTIQYDPIFAAAPDKVGSTMEFLGMQVDALTLICLLLFMGAMGKSAQFLLHTWLPDAMEGPTPVSALIHAATMVTAGVFMVARFSPVFEHSPFALEVVTFIGATTAFFAATVALVQTDIKRVIAYSTCSQLGYMFTALGIGAFNAGVFHLFTHAFFKALLFLGAGAVIHAVHDEQDMRRMGGLRAKMPFTWAMMLVGTLALTGFPFTSGYVSKDAIIEGAWLAHGSMAMYGYVMTLLAAALTSFYSWRLMFLTFEGRNRGPKDVYEHAHDAPMVMAIPLAVLAIGSLLAGAYFMHDFIGIDVHSFWRNAIFLPEHTGHHEVSWLVFLSPSIVMFAGLAVAWYFYMVKPLIPFGLSKRFRGAYQFLLNAWYFDALYDRIFVRPAKWLAYKLWKVGDGKIIDGIGPDGVSARVIDITNRVVKIQTGYIYHYAFVMLIGVAILITYFMFTGGGLPR